MLSDKEERRRMGKRPRVLKRLRLYSAPRSHDGVASLQKRNSDELKKRESNINRLADRSIELKRIER